MVADDPLIGTVVDGRYRILERVGHGGMGSVYRAVEQTLDREVALKRILPEHAGTPRLRQRFRHEARAVARLNHPGVAQVYAFGTLEDGSPYLAMEYVGGGSLHTLIRRPPDLDTVLAVFDRILGTLAYTHARDVVHRDLKPENILLAPGEDGLPMPKLVDFGIAALGEDESSSISSGELPAVAAEGTPRYMAPEQAIGRRPGPAADVYSVGVMLYEALSGTRPFDADDTVEIMVSKLNDEAPPLTARAGLTLPEGLADTVLRAMARDPEQRFLSAADLARALRVFQGERRAGPGRAPPTTLDPPSDGDAETPFVGREALRRELLEAARRVIDGEGGQVVLLEGEAGIGKSRLAEWLRTTVEQRGDMMSLRGAWTETGSSEQDGLVGMLESRLGSHGLDRAAVAELLDHHLSGHSEVGEDEAEKLLDFLRPTADSTTINPERSFALVERFLRRLAATRPVLVWLDDLHWGGAHAVNFVRHVLVGLQVTPARILVLSTVRDEALSARSGFAEAYRAFSRREEDLLLLRVERLSPDETRELVRRMGAALHAGDIQARTRGNPLFTVQLARYLRAGAADESVDPMEPTRPAHSEPEGLDDLPEALRRVLEARLEQAVESTDDPDAARRLLEVIALLGARVPLLVLEDYLDDSDPGTTDAAMELVDLLINNRILAEVAGSAGARIEFEHGLLREAILADLSPRRARRIHLRCARVKMRRDRVQMADEIGRHLVEAGRIAEALPHLLTAAERAERRGRYYAAAGLYRQVAEQLDPVEEARRYAEAWTGAGRCLHRSGEPGAARDALERAGRADDPDSAAQAWLERASMELTAGRTAEVRRAVTEAEHLLEQVEDPSPLDGDIALMEAALLSAEGRLEEAREAFDQLAQREPTDEQKLRLLPRQAYNEYLLGGIDRTHALLTEARRLSRRGDDPVERARILRSLAALASDRFAPSEAEATVREALEIFEESGARSDVAICHISLGEFAREDGRLEEAEAHYRAALELGRALENPRFRIYGLINLAHTAFAQKDGVRSAELLGEALDQAVAHNLNILLRPIRIDLAAAAAMRGELAAAEEFWTAVNESEAETQLITEPDMARSLEMLGKLGLQAGKDWAREPLLLAAEQWGRLGNRERAERCRELADS